jgi:hypothetical protein
MTNLLAQLSEAQVLGVVIGKGPKLAIKVKFEGNLDDRANWLKKQFCEWAKREEHQLVVTVDAANHTVEIK